MITIQVANRQTRHPVDPGRLSEAAHRVLDGEGRPAARLSLAVVDDAAIHELNRKYLGHDYPTDVLSFLLEEGPARIEGEVIVSADTAAEQAPAAGWSLDDELVLYVIHGTLHLVGYDDADDASRRAMRAGEQKYLKRMGIDPSAAGLQADFEPQ